MNNNEIALIIVRNFLGLESYQDIPYKFMSLVEDIKEELNKKDIQ